MGDNHRTCTTGCLLACFFLCFYPVFASSQDTTMSGGSIAGIVVGIVALITAGGSIALCKKCQLFCFHPRSSAAGNIDSETQTNNGGVNHRYHGPVNQYNGPAQPQNDGALQLYNHHGGSHNMAIMPHQLPNMPKGGYLQARHIHEETKDGTVREIREMTYYQRE